MAVVYRPWVAPYGDDDFEWNRKKSFDTFAEMSTPADKPKEYFIKLLELRDEKIDYSEIPPTTVVDWQDAEVLLPVTAEEFRAIKLFVSRLREWSPERTGG
jgi:hypothetical protein